MPALSQELVDAIIEELSDFDSLKQCSLVGPAFRYPSQRILLRFLTLRAPSAIAPQRTPFSTVLGFLEESPHVTGFITNLTVWIPRAVSPIAEIETLIKVLDRLTKVRSCALSGAAGKEETSAQKWKGIPANLATALLGFLARQPLDRLRVRSLTFLPISILAHILASATMVTFVEAVCMEGCSMEDGSHPDIDETSTLVLPESFCLRSLGGGRIAVSILQVLVHPQFAKHLAHLRQLELPVNWSEYQYGLRILRTAADHLEQVTLNCLSYHTHKPIILPLPPLPMLQRFEFSLSIEDLGASWFTDAIVALLAPALTPSLTKLVVRIRRERYNSQVNPTTNLLSALDDAVIAHPASPSIRWEVNYKPQSFTTFQRRVEQYMPKTHERGHLFLENDPTPPTSRWNLPFFADDVGWRLASVV
ncbi:hypothetical protein DFH06DRAFT_448248 [Mycena polygramma]|nr:hypothetical protein DFH06DRAFT_448248 [Mycena polygramma]